MAILKHLESIIVVIGRSHIVGSPMSILIAGNAKVGSCAVTLTHGRTNNLEEITRSANILVNSFR